MATVKPPQSLRVNAKIRRRLGRGPTAEILAGQFGLSERTETLYEDFELPLAPGRISAVVGPSGSGKSVLLASARRARPDAVELSTAPLQATGRAAIHCIGGLNLPERIELLSRCGLAEPAALLTPARHLSGGQRYRLALAAAVAESRRRGAPLILADEFASVLDKATASMLARQVRRWASRGTAHWLIATPHDWLLANLQPDRVIAKPLAGLAEVIDPPRWRGRIDPRRWPIRRGSLDDYRALSWWHYLAGPPAAHVRVWAIDAPRRLRGWGAPPVAAVCVVSPPVPNARGRNLAFPGRFAGRDASAALARLNEQVECISRIVVHPVYRAAGLAVRLARHAIASAERPIVEALAAMGALHPLFERAGMRAVRPPTSPAAARLHSAMEWAGLTPGQLAAVEPLRRTLGRSEPALRRFLQCELDRFARTALGPRRLARLEDPLPAICRKAVAGYVYYYHQAESA